MLIESEKLTVTCELSRGFVLVEAAISLLTIQVKVYLTLIAALSTHRSELFSRKNRLRYAESNARSSAARVKLPVDLLETRLVDVRVDLRGGEAGVAEHFLDRAQVRAMAEQVRGEGMPQQVRPDFLRLLDARELRRVLHQLPQPRGGQAPAMLAEEDFATGFGFDEIEGLNIFRLQPFPIPSSLLLVICLVRVLIPFRVLFLVYVCALNIV